MKKSFLESIIKLFTVFLSHVTKLVNTLMVINAYVHYHGFSPGERRRRLKWVSENRSTPRAAGAAEC